MPKDSRFRVKYRMNQNLGAGNFMFGLYQRGSAGVLPPGCDYQDIGHSQIRPIHTRTEIAPEYALLFRCRGRLRVLRNITLTDEILHVFSRDHLQVKFVWAIDGE